MSELELPESWASGRLEDLCIRIQYGATASAKNKGSCKLLRITDITDSGVNWESVPFCDLPVKDVNKYLLTDGDVVIARTGGTVGKSFRVLGIPSESVVFASYLIRLSLCSQLREDLYLTLFLRSPNYWRFITDAARGAAQPNVNATILGGIDVPLPPLREQRRIVAKIESTFKRIEAIEKAVETAESLLVKYRESLLNKAFRGELVPQDPNDEPASKLLERIRTERAKQQDGKKKKKEELPPITEEEIPFEIPKSWEWVRLGDVFEIKTGATPKRGTSRFFEGGNIPWVKTGEVNNCEIHDAEEYITLAAVQETNAKVFPPNTLLVAMYGEGKTRGQVGLLKISASTNQACAALLSNTIASDCVAYVFKYLYSQYIKIRAMAAGASQLNLNLEIVSNLLMPLPPLEEQERIVAELNGSFDIFDNTVSIYKAVTERLSQARSSILASAFSGRLVPQDPSEGTGHQLLEQILAAKSNADSSQPVKSPAKKRKSSK